MQKYICTSKTVREIWAKRQFCVQNYLIMRLSRQVCGVLWLNLKSTFSSLELGVHGVTKCSFSCRWGQETPWLQAGFSPAPGSLSSLMTPDALLGMGFGVHKLRRKTPLPRCANPLWQPTSPHMTSNGRTWQGQWLLCHRGYLCSLKSPTCTQEGPSPSFSTIKCFLFRNLHNLRAIFSPHNQAPLKAIFTQQSQRLAGLKHWSYPPDTFFNPSVGLQPGKWHWLEELLLPPLLGFNIQYRLVLNTTHARDTVQERKTGREKKNRRLKRRNYCANRATNAIYRLNCF